MSKVFILFVSAQISILYTRMASVLYTITIENFWTKVGLKVLFRITSICEDFPVFFLISFSFS